VFDVGRFYTAQICENGHVITSELTIYPNLSQKYCVDCSAPTITACPSCGAEIHGDYEGDYDAFEDSFQMDKAPSYCYECGEPYPWTKKALASAKLLIEEDENLNEFEKQQFNETLSDLAIPVPTPKTNLSVARFKKLITKANEVTIQSVQNIIIEIASETIRKSLGL
jgi:hypothetical protein